MELEGNTGNEGREGREPIESKTGQSRLSGHRGFQEKFLRDFKENVQSHDRYKGVPQDGRGSLREQCESSVLIFGTKLKE